ncbi:plasma kallikrein [Trichonephila clavipes]|nr:plasma kallikrein [Trichonephila clavipes]
MSTTTALIGIFFLSTVNTVLSKEIPAVNNTLACGASQPLVVTEKFGFLTSPKFNNFNYYPANQNCSWTLKAAKGKVFILIKMFFALNMDCGTDVLNLYDGEPPYHKKIGAFCGYWVPSRYKSKNSTLHLSFISGRTPRNVGFQFYFEQVDPSVVCKENQVTCRHRTKCVDLDKKCDGVDQCGDGTDEEKCEKKNTTLGECGIPVVKPVLDSNRIVGGRDAVPGSWPWQVSLRLIANEPFSHWCGGVLINNQWLLTAGHCFKKNLDVRNWNVLFGKHFRLVPEDTEQLRYMESIHIHPKYNLNETRLSIPWIQRKQHDLALVKLNAPVTVTDYISHICLPPANHTIPVGTMCYVTGWGETYGTGFELELKQAAVPIVSLEQCRKWHKFYDVAPTMVCAGHADGGHDSCQGDSGGPLVYSNDNKQWHLAGIVSTGGSICADKEQPGIYTLVPYYVDWIESTIKRNT